ncbi:MAG: helix-turn-helix transcriptional regulator [Clostridia bacterium]|nr:helix-turn-helix transcriptional regulator [Clostridia bacterium]
MTSDVKSISVKIDCHSDNGKEFYVHYCVNSHDAQTCPDSPLCNRIIVFLDDKIQTRNFENITSCSAGDCLISTAGETVTADNFFKNGFECLKIDFPIDAFDGIEGSGIFVDVFNNSEIIEGNLLRTDSESKGRIIKTARRIIGALGEKTRDKLMAYSYIIQLMHLIDNAFKERKFICISDKMPNVVFEAIQYIYTNISKIESIKEIAENVNVSMSYLARLFKQHLGCSPYDYLVNRRIENAKILMCYLDYSVAEACYEVGFNDYSSFITVFKKKTGMTPHVYKKSHS